ncbi:MAG: beta-N-acetylhexosaminidase family protein, partial [Planctomycetota bacterium]
MSKAGISVLVVLLSFAAHTFAAGQIDLSEAVVVSSSKKTIHVKATQMLRDEIQERTRITLDIASKMPNSTRAAIVIGTGKGFTKKVCTPPPGLAIPQEPEGYALWVDTDKRKAPTVCLAGYDDRGALYATGRLLRLLKMTRDNIKLDGNVKLATAPTWGLRGHQLGYRAKTNSYDAWTIEIWEQYYRDMVVFGMNALELIPPKSDDDDDSPHLPKPQLEMMIDMSQLADDYGLDVWIWWPAIDGDYSDPKVVESGLRDRDDVLKQLPRVDVVFVPGGDPGKTHPKILLPFMEKHKDVLNRYHPNAQMWVSPQGFDRGGSRQGWLRAFFDILQIEEPKWLDGVVFGPQVETSLENLRKEVPAQYPIRRYPDITHSRSSQYAVPNWDSAYKGTLGREPINPRPRAYAKIFRDLQQYAIGYITYSEGCNDDLNKIVW